MDHVYLHVTKPKTTGTSDNTDQSRGLGDIGRSEEPTSMLMPEPAVARGRCRL